MVQKGSRVAAIYDVHGNLPALDAVLAELESINPDLIVVGGDVVAGPMPTEVLERLAALGESIYFVRGNADREVVAAYDDGRYAAATDAADPAEPHCCVRRIRDRPRTSGSTRLLRRASRRGGRGSRAGLVLPWLTEERRGDRYRGYDRRAAPRDPRRSRSRHRSTGAHPRPV